MYETKIPGTRYVCALTSIKGQWMIQMKLSGNVEAQTLVKDLSERGIRDNIRTVTSEVNLVINDFLIEQIVKDIATQAEILLKEISATASHTPIQQNVSEFEDVITQIKGRLDLLEERIKRIESALEHRS